MNIGAINVAPMRSYNKCNRAIIFIFQGGHVIEEEFTNICHHAKCDDLTFMEAFWCRLDDEIQLVMPRGDPCWTQPEYTNFALWVDGSSFTVEEVDSIPIVQSH